jgi:hypothetical protein
LGFRFYCSGVQVVGFTLTAFKPGAHDGIGEIKRGEREARRGECTAEDERKGKG